MNFVAWMPAAWLRGAGQSHGVTLGWLLAFVTVVASPLLPGHGREAGVNSPPCSNSWWSAE